MTAARIGLLPGDGIGPEVVASARQVLEQVARIGAHDFRFEVAAMGGAAVDELGVSLPSTTLELCRQCDAVLLGAVGGPRWANLEGDRSPEQGLLRLRRELDLFANLRPVPVFPALIPSAPLRPDLLTGVDILVVRELTGGIYFGPRREAGEGDQALDTMVYSVAEIERIAHVAFQAARQRRGRVTSVDKANVLATSRLWRRTVERVAGDYPDIELRHLYVDACAMHLLRMPRDFDVLLTENLFGDILSDEASMLAGSLGILPSASLTDGRFGLYEPIHGSAPEVADQGIANPLGAILSAAMMLRHSLELPAAATAVEAAVNHALETGLRTADLPTEDASAVTTAQMTEAVVAALT